MGKNSVLLSKIKSVNENTLQKNAFLLILIWIVSPLLIMLLNFIRVDGATIYNIWIYIVDVLGGIGLANGLIYLEHLISQKDYSISKIAYSLLPLVLLVAFLLWSLISCLLAVDKRMAFFGRSPMYDCWSIYVLYGGFILSGLIVSKNKDKVVQLAKIITVVALIQAIIALMDNALTERLCVIPSFTNCFHYQSVFYNTNHYGYYILITSLIAAFLFLYLNKLRDKLIYAIIFAIFVYLLVFNNTLGVYLALFVSLVFVLAWRFINGESNKFGPLILIVLFVGVTLLTTITSDNMADNLLGVLTDFDRLAENKNLDAVGSGRGDLWKNALMCIKEQPILGCGFQNEGAYPLDIFTLPHNIFLQMAKYTGIPGLLIYVSVFVVGATRLLHERKTINSITEAAGFIVVGYMMSAFFGVTKFYTSPYFLIVLGVCMGECLKKTNERKESA